MSEEYSKLSASEKKKEDWMNSKWRPMMGWMYMSVCTFDFMVAPILWSLVQTLGHGNVSTQWQPLTLQGAGLFHVAMGAVLGIAAFGRTQEKLAGANNGGAPTMGTTYTPPPSTPSPSGFNSPAPATPSFGSPSGFGAAPADTSVPAPTAPAPTTGMPGRSSLSKN